MAHRCHPARAFQQPAINFSFRLRQGILRYHWQINCSSLRLRKAQPGTPGPAGWRPVPRAGTGPRIV